MNALETFEQLVIAAGQETDVAPLMEPFYALDRQLINRTEDNAEANAGIVRESLAQFMVTPLIEKPLAILPLSDGKSRLVFKWLDPPKKGLNFWLTEGSSDEVRTRLQSLQTD